MLEEEEEENKEKELAQQKELKSLLNNSNNRRIHPPIQFQAAIGGSGLILLQAELYHPGASGLLTLLTPGAQQHPHSLSLFLSLSHAHTCTYTHTHTQGFPQKLPNLSTFLDFLSLQGGPPQETECGHLRWVMMGRAALTWRVTCR